MAAGCVAALAACQPATTATPTSVVAVDTSVDVANAVPVSSARAVGLFLSVCEASLPNFRNAPSMMTRAGVSETASTGTVFSSTEDVSLKILDGPGTGTTCSFVFATTESRSSVFATYGRAFGEILQSELGPVAANPRRTTLILMGEPRGNGGLNYFNLRMLSER